MSESMEDIVTAIIYKARWVDGIKTAGAHLVSDREIAKAIVEDFRVRPAVLKMPDNTVESHFPNWGENAYEGGAAFRRGMMVVPMDVADSLFSGPVMPMAVRGGIKYPAMGATTGRMSQTTPDLQTLNGVTRKKMVTPFDAEFYYGPDGVDRCKFCKCHVVPDPADPESWIHKWDEDPACTEMWSGTKPGTWAEPVDRREP